MKPTNKISRYIGLSVIVVVLVIFVGFYGFNIYKQTEVDNYNKAVQDILLKTNNKLFKLSSYLRNFVVVSEHAKKFAPKFQEAADVTSKAAKDLKSIDPPNQFKLKHNRLTQAYEDGAHIYSDLNKLAIYLVERDKILKKIVKDLKSFASKITKTKEQKKAKGIAKLAQDEISKDLESIKKLKTPINIYNDKIIIKYSDSLAKHLRDFQKKLAGDDMYEVQMALYYIQVDYAGNWQKAFFTADKKALRDYDERVKAVQKVTF